MFTKSHLFLFAFIWDMALICILVFNLESYEYFRPVFVEVLCHSFMRFVKVIFFPMKLYKKNLLAWKVYYRIYYIFSFLLSHMFPWMNKFLITENRFLPRLVKWQSCSSSHCIFQSFSALNTRSTKVLRRNVVEVLIMLLIKQ